MFAIFTDTKDFGHVYKWLQSFGDALAEPKTMNVGVQAIGRGMQEIFKTEGAAGKGRWRRLSQTTRRLREERGLQPEHPILVQYGSLKNVTADSIANHPLDSNSITKTGDKIALVTSSRPLQFLAGASGRKMINHWGGEDYEDDADGEESEPFSVPERAFFLITQDSFNTATTLINGQLIKGWAAKDPRAQVI